MSCEAGVGGDSRNTFVLAGGGLQAPAHGGVHVGPERGAEPDEGGDGRGCHILAGLDLGELCWEMRGGVCGWSVHR